MRLNERVFPTLGLGTVAAGLPALVIWLVGDKHVHADRLGNVQAGDGSIYNGAVPASSARIGGPAHPLAADAQSPYQINFGGVHTGICQFLHADGSVRTYANAMSPELLAHLIRRD